MYTASAFQKSESFGLLFFHLDNWDTAGAHGQSMAFGKYKPLRISLFLSFAEGDAAAQALDFLQRIAF